MFIFLFPFENQINFVSVLFLNRLKDMYEETTAKRPDIEHLKKESDVLSSWSTNSDIIKKTKDLESQWQSLLDKCLKNKQLLESEIQECALYHQSLQDVEKWVLQMSFQLMAQNSLYITNKAQTEEQILQHNSLLQEILRYVINIG